MGFIKLCLLRLVMGKRDIFHFRYKRGTDPEDMVYRLFRSKFWNDVFYYAPSEDGFYLVTDKTDNEKRRQLVKEMAELGYCLANSH